MSHFLSKVVLAHFLQIALRFFNLQRSSFLKSVFPLFPAGDVAARLPFGQGVVSFHQMIFCHPPR